MLPSNITYEEYQIEYGTHTVNGYEIRSAWVPGHLFKRIDDEVIKCQCGQESTWKSIHRRNCPPEKHSDYCEVYKSWSLNRVIK